MMMMILNIQRVLQSHIWRCPKMEVPPKPGVSILTWSHLGWFAVPLFQEPHFYILSTKGGSEHCSNREHQVISQEQCRIGILYVDLLMEFLASYNNKNVGDHSENAGWMYAPTSKLNMSSELETYQPRSGSIKFTAIQTITKWVRLEITYHSVLPPYVRPPTKNTNKQYYHKSYVCHPRTDKNTGYTQRFSTLGN